MKRKKLLRRTFSSIILVNLGSLLLVTWFATYSFRIFYMDQTLEHLENSILMIRPEIAELLLMFAARSFNVNNVILPALEAGTWVVCDRFTDSSRAYQGGGRGIPMETIDRVADWVHGDTWPDVTILLDAPVEIGMERAGKRSAPDRFEQERHEFFQRVRECYLQLAANEPGRFVVIDTTRSIEEVAVDIRTVADQLLSN